MKQILFMSAALLLALGTSAQVTRGTVGDGTYVDYSGAQYTNVGGLDFNNDGFHEFALSCGYTEEGTPVESGTLSFVWTEGGTNVATISDAQWDKIKYLPLGELVGPGTGWYAQGDATVIPSDAESEVSDMYVGLRIKLGSNIHYGWAHVEITSTGNDGYTATWKEIYYQASNNTAIAVGDRNSAGIVAAGTFPVTAKVSGRDIIVNTASNDVVCLYDLSGRLVSTRATAGQCTLTAPGTGAYIVRTGKTSLKVIVR